jgi:hypothetical protein
VVKARGRASVPFAFLGDDVRVKKKNEAVVKTLKADNGTIADTGAGENSETKPTTKRVKKPPLSLKTITQNKLQRGWPKVMDKMIKEAEAGDLNKMLLVSDLVGFKNENGEQKKSRGKTFTEVLMGELKKKQKAAGKKTGNKKTDDKDSGDAKK